MMSHMSEIHRQLQTGETDPRPEVEALKAEYEAEQLRDRLEFLDIIRPNPGEMIVLRVKPGTCLSPKDIDILNINAKKCFPNNKLVILEIPADIVVGEKADMLADRAELLTSPNLPGKIDLLRKRWWELFRAEVTLRDFDRTKTGIRFVIQDVDDARKAVLDAVREFFYEEMGGGQ